MDIRRKTFVAEATSRLSFLIQEHGFAAPEVTEDGNFPLVIHVIYHRGDLEMRESLVLSYGGEEYVTAHLEHKNPARRTELHAGTAHTGFQMWRALDRHALALREFFGEQDPMAQLR